MRACTVTIQRRLPFARVTASTFLLHHPGSSFATLVLDGDGSGIPAQGETLLLPSDVGLAEAELHELLMFYDHTDATLACAPWLLGHELGEGDGVVVYLADDTRVFAPLDRMFHADLEGLRLTRKTHLPLPNDALTPSEDQLLSDGPFETGVLAVGAGRRPLLEWWIKRVTAQTGDSFIAPARLVNLATNYFPHRIDESLEVASCWNLHDRWIEPGDPPMVEGHPVATIRFEGYDPSEPFLLSIRHRSAPRILLSERPDLQRLTEEYDRALRANGYADADDNAYAFDHLPSGIEIDERMRGLYRGGLRAARKSGSPQPPDPFKGDDFIDWLNTPDPLSKAPKVARYLLALYDERLDLQIAFPGIAGADGARFLAWVRDHGVSEYDIPAPLRPGPEVTSIVRQQEQSPDLSPGMNVAGYFHAELGVGEMARLLINGAQASDIPFATVDYGLTMSRQDHPFETSGRRYPYDINVICVNADQLDGFVSDSGAEVLSGRYNIGLWWWEVERLPIQMGRAAHWLDEIWAGSEHVAEAVRGATDKPVFVVPLPVRTFTPEPATRSELGIPESFLFLFTFDFLSVFERKNPLGLVEAFTRAFSEGEGPTLYIKSINGHLRVAQLEHLRYAAGGRKDIVIFDGYLPPDRKDSLLAACDCYVSLHRAEGYGLGLIEAMSLGKPVIATGYSGNLAFMDQSNSYLVGYQMVPIPTGLPPYPPDASWAEPSIDEAAKLMRRVFADRDEARGRGAAARAVASKHSAERTAAFIHTRFKAIRAIIVQRRAIESADPQDQGVALPPTAT